MIMIMMIMIIMSIKAFDFIFQVMQQWDQRMVWWLFIQNWGRQNIINISVEQTNKKVESKLNFLTQLMLDFLHKQTQLCVYCGRHQTISMWWGSMSELSPTTRIGHSNVNSIYRLCRKAVIKENVYHVSGCWQIKSNQIMSQSVESNTAEQKMMVWSLPHLFSPFYCFKHDDFSPFVVVVVCKKLARGTEIICSHFIVFSHSLRESDRDTDCKLSKPRYYFHFLIPILLTSLWLRWWAWHVIAVVNCRKLGGRSQTKSSANQEDITFTFWFPFFFFFMRQAFDCSGEHHFLLQL